MRGQRGAAARAVRRYAVALIDEAPVPQLLYYPPAGLYVVVGQRFVRLLHVHPEPDTLGEVVPLLYVAEYALAALLVEVGHAVGLDLVLGGEAQLPLNLQLHGEAVGVPPRLARGAVALHGAVARDNVLEHPRQYVVHPRAGVGRGRPLVQQEHGGVLALLNAALEDAPLLPELKDAPLHFREAYLADYRFKHPSYLLQTVNKSRYSVSETPTSLWRGKAPFCGV